MIRSSRDVCAEPKEGIGLLQSHKNAAVRDSLTALVLAALFAAMSIVLGKYLAFNIWNVLRFSLENLPILLSGILLGPVFGLATGVVADLVGCVLVGYTINPVVTVGAAVIGLLGGLVFRLAKRFPMGVRLAFVVASAHLIGSVLIKTPGLAAYYSFPLWELFLWRLLNYLIVGVPEWLILYSLLKIPAMRRLFIR